MWTFLFFVAELLLVVNGNAVQKRQSNSSDLEDIIEKALKDINTLETEVNTLKNSIDTSKFLYKYMYMQNVY